MRKMFPKIAYGHKILILGIVLLFCVLIITFTNTLSVTTTSTIWDGVVATTFNEGTGTYDDPYIISCGGEFVYFLTQMDEEGMFTSDIKITNNIDFNGADLSLYTTNINSFAGHIDGRGYTLSNFAINNPKVETNAYSLFGNLTNATIENINFESVTINANDDYDISLLSNNIANTTIKNINILNLNIYKESNTLGVIFNNDLGNNTIKDINVDVTSNDGYIITNNYLDSNISNIIYKNNSLSIINTEDELTNIYSYIITDTIEFNNISSDEVLQILNFENDVTWDITGVDINMIPVDSSFMDEIVSLSLEEIVEHESGTSGTTVYVNDFEADYNYYMGLNYTESEDGKLPSLKNKNYYNDSNLVKVQITYNGSNIEGNLTGTVSISENQNKYIYYKYYPVNNNGTSDTSDDYIEIELIDNPFTNRPTDRAFYGWVTDNNDAIISLNTENYIRTAKVPVTYINDECNDIVIDFYSLWYDANYASYSQAGNWNKAFDNLKPKGMQELFIKSPVYGNLNFVGYYTRVNIGLLSSYAGYYNNRGQLQNNGTCYTVGGCTYYKLETVDEYDASKTYYHVEKNNMVAVDNSIFDFTITDWKQAKTSLSTDNGLYKQVTISNGNSINGLYNEEGIIQNGNCNSSSCVLYELVQASSAQTNIDWLNETYYYYSSRDTNIIFLNANVTSMWSNDKPFTLTSVYNGSDVRGSYYIDIRSTYINCYADTTLENIRIYTRTARTNGEVTPTGSGGNIHIYGNWYNLKIGRGLTQNGQNVNATGVVGGNTTSVGSVNNLKKYTLRIESGIYNSLGAATGSNSGTNYIEGVAIYGNDYDRVANNNNNLIIRNCASGTWGGDIYSSSNTKVAITTIIKSGRFGDNKYDYATGVYVGGRGGGTFYAPRAAIIEGGYVYNVLGGPLTSLNQSTYNDTYIYMKGGETDIIIGGAGRTETYGNRIVQVTGGTVNYSVFGGSNGIEGSNSANSLGTLSGTPYVYIGGNAQIGNATLVANNTIESKSSCESGSVFGIGNGRTGYNSIGSADNSNVIIDGNAHILRNVYGGGNYGSTGINSESNTNKTTINILGGTIDGSVYGGGNNNGAGSATKQSTININVYDGTINNIYGGSRTTGTIYGDANITTLNGTINNIYGGGEGGYTSNNASGTYVSRNINVNIGNDSNGPTIKGNVYGGSAYGTVNADSRDAAANTNTVNITVNNGSITGSVFGGAKGSNTITPYVKGNIEVTINNGLIGTVYGGFDQSGTPQGTSKVYLKGGTIGSVFGGGNLTSINSSNVYEQGSTVNYLYGGSNNSGTVTTSNINMTSGTVGYVYGGNNLGGSTVTANTTIDGGAITYAIYGGGNNAGTTTNNLILNSTDNTVPLVVGGDKSASTTTTNIKTKINANVLYGASDQSGNVEQTNVEMTAGNIPLIYGGGNNAPSDNTSIIITGGSVNTIFGGGNKGITGNTVLDIKNVSGNVVYGGCNDASTISTDVTLENVNFSYVYGGGNLGSVTSAETKIKSGTITEAYGGGNKASVDETNIDITGGTINEAYGGGNEGTVTTTNIKATGNSTSIGYLFGGGNNEDGVVGNTNVIINKPTIGTVYGGGNRALVTTDTDIDISESTITETVYGGGNQGSVNGNTSLVINNSTINENIFGGGNNGVVKGNTDVLLEDVNINMSAYAGGNGSTATVEGNTTITAGGETIIGLSSCETLSTCSIFGGGNAATTGTASKNNSKATVNIAGATIYGNLYGGANTSVVYGTTRVNVGASYTPTGIITKDDINISGTVFGGGEANASGSENYDFSFISVTRGIDVEIDGNEYNQFDINGSIFGSGNASSTTGPSVINIFNYGKTRQPKSNISIQRTDVLTLDNSSIQLSGATDRTNEYKTTLFTLSRVTVLNLKGSTLYLEENANLLQEFNSLNSDNTYATVSIDESSMTRSNNNRLYLRDGINLNIELNEQNTEYGIVNGMTFLGMFRRNNNGAPNVGVYDDYSFGDEANTLSAVFDTGSYVMGYHKSNHNIEVDGFYTNKVDEETNRITMLYVEPTPADATYYRWLIGENIIQYNIELVASKYSTLGTAELNLYDFYKENTSINIIGFDSSELEKGNSLIEKNEVPRVALNSDIADTVMSISMQPGNSGWLTDGETHFVSDDRLYTGTTEYVGENSTKVPSLLFYLNHSKNLGSTGDMGKVKIVLMAVTKLSDLKNEITRLVINIDLSRVIYTTNDYEASLTPGRKYEMFKSTSTAITSNSSLSAYYSLFIEDQNVYKTGYKRALVTNNVLPLDTKITMIDLSGDQPEYYYHIINASDVARTRAQIETDREVIYDLSIFNRMGTDNSANYYDNGNDNIEYYDPITNISSEEFIFIVDFKDAIIDSNMLGNTIMLELMTPANETKIGCLGIEQADMKYDIYKTNKTPLYVNGTSTSNTIYPGDEFTLDVTTKYDLINVDSKVVYDTEYFEHQMGIKLSIINPSNQVVSGTSLLGLYYEIDGVEYHPNIDGTTRIKISEKVGDVEKWIKVYTGQSNMSSGEYKLRIEAFGSADGIFYGLNTLSYTDIPLTVINEIYGMDIETTTNQMVVDGKTGVSLAGTNLITYDISYTSALDNPNIHIKLYRRDYSTTYSTNYIPVDLGDYVTNALIDTSKEYEYLIVNNPREETTLKLLMKPNLLRGTYKVQFILCDNDAEIGTIDKYIVIK